ncbi:MAG: glycoside hydrolase family 38 C-terminal domain-containing protein [Paracoccaceae bacterium]|nr:glycoside hydrolase family 38 C-terminal domain-containing protein [Paracoccaceae bacterium]
MSHARRFTAEKIGKRIALVQRMAHRQSLPIAPFRYLELPDAVVEPPLTACSESWRQIEWNSYWAGQNQDYLLRSEFTIPAGWADGPIALYLPMGAAGDIFTHPESLIYVDGVPYASADRYHHTIYLDPKLADGLTHRIDLHGWSGLTGWPPDPNDRTRLFMKPCKVVEIDVPTRDFIDRAEVSLDVANKLERHRPEKARILNALDASFLELDTRDPLGDAFWRSVPRATEVLEQGLKKAGPPTDVTLHAIGHAHMDVAYLWPVSQIRRKNARTYSNVLRLMERFPDYIFSHSQPQLYDFTREDYPELFEAIKERVEEGRWELIGGMWVEADTNIPSAESLARQILLGRRFFREHFGDTETPVLWLPDVFGITWSLPQLMKQAGLNWFMSNKPSWNQYNQMPASTTWWEGIDGTRILTHFLTTPRDVQHLPFPTNYKSDLSAEEVIGTWDSSTVKEHISDLPICYGYGDGGGGPTGQLIRRAIAYQDMPGAPKLEFSTVRAFFEKIEPQSASLPVWSGEFYLEAHRGVLTSQAWIKRANRQAETALAEADFLSALAVGTEAETANRADLDTAWKRLCLNQFHDILPGTSITEVFEDARKDFDEIAALAEGTSLRSIAAAGTGDAQTVVSTLPCSVARQFETKDALPEGFDPAGVQHTEDGALVRLGEVAPWSITPVAAEAPEHPVTAIQTDAGITLENACIRLEINPDGDITRIFDKRSDREVLAAGAIGNRLQVFEDRPLSWDAWDIDAFFEDRGEIITGFTEMEVTETGPLRAAVRIVRTYRRSTIEQVIRLTSDGARIDFVTDIDWHETHLLLKVAFPVNVKSQRATYEIQWGSIERPTHRNTLWDYAKFEVPAQKWADLSEGDYGVALLNDCKYGYDIRENVMRLSLIKAATMPDPVADQGRHQMTYALLPHSGDWRMDVMDAAYELNRPLRSARARPRPAFATSSAEHFFVETVKPSEDGGAIVVRGFEAFRQRGPVTLTFDRRYARISTCSLLEDAEVLLAENADQVTFDVTPFQIVSLLLEP